MIPPIFGTAGETVTIEGYAQDFDSPIAAVQFSCDEGRTWTSHETPNADSLSNVNWSFAFTPPREGNYRLLIRTVCANGQITPEPASVTLCIGAQN